MEQIKTKRKVDRLEEKIEKIGTKVITVEDLNESNNNISDAIHQLKNEMNFLSQKKHSGNSCNEAEANVTNITDKKKTEDHIDDINHFVKQEKGKKHNLSSNL